MENTLILIAAGLAGVCLVLSLIKPQERLKKLTFLFWSLSAAAIIMAIALLIFYQVTSNFSYQYVYNHTSRNLAYVYKMSALWAGQEGSFLLWALILSLIGFACLRIKNKNANLAFGIYAGISVCIFTMSYIVKPFAKMSNTPIDGLGLNEALKDPWMVVHPPLVFISYSTMAVLFSIALLKRNGKEDDNRVFLWLRISWMFLGFGILSGSIWAYHALGWGGYWAWDPIENMALVPWLVMTGLLHSKVFNRLNCLTPFIIACAGVFLVRSGILKGQSTHAYSDGNIIITAIIICLAVVIFILYVILRFKQESTLGKTKINDMKILTYVLNGYAGLIFIGTFVQMISKMDWLIIYYKIISVIFVLAYSVLLLKRDFESLKRKNIYMIIVSTILVIAIMYVYKVGNIFGPFVLWVCLMPLSLWFVSGFKTGSLKYYLPHLGTILLITGVISSSALGSNAVAIVHLENININGINISQEEFYENNVLIRSKLMEDIIIKSSEARFSEKGELLISYETRPLIILFWIGGFIIIGQPLLYIFTKRWRRQANPMMLS